MWKNLASNVLTLIIVGLVAAAAAAGWAQREWVGEGPLETAMCLQVPQGGNMAGVARDLEEAGAVSSGSLFRVGSNYSGRQGDLKAGSFLIEPGQSMEQILASVTGDGRSTCGTRVAYIIGVNGQEVRVRELDPDTQEFAITAEFDPKVTTDMPEAFETARQDVATEYLVTIVEGATSWQIVEGLKAFTLLDGEVPEVPGEGTLAPGSYEIRPGANRQAFLAELERLQAAQLARAWEARAEDAPVNSPEEALILASIIEKETGIAEERPLVASVFANRLAQGIRLQTDPTVIYGVTGGQGVLGRGLRQSELRAETPYNTYVIDGLPPGPIANPGEAAIRAALDPAETDYIFFVANCEGGHEFAVTLDEHNRNVAEWRRCEAERAAAAEETAQ